MILTRGLGVGGGIPALGFGFWIGSAVAVTNTLAQLTAELEVFRVGRHTGLYVAPRQGAQTVRLKVL